MSMQDGDRFYKVASWWPVIVTALAITVSAAQANSRLDYLGDRVAMMEEKGPSGVNERLARIETQQVQMAKTLERVENKLDNELTISPESRKRLNKL